MFTPIVLAGMLLAAQAEAPPLAKEVGQLVRALDAPQASERNAAEEQLVKLGPDVLPLLPPADDRTAAEVIQRLARVRQQLEKMQAERTAKSSLVTLKAAAESTSAVLKELEKQTGNKIVDHRSEMGEETPDPKITIDVKQMPFLKALDTVLDAAQLSVYNFAGKPGVYLVGRSGGQAPRLGSASYSGPFRIEPMRFEAIRDLRTAQGGATGSMTLFLEITWEPRIAPIAITQPLTEVAAKGNDGSALATAASGESEAAVTETVAAVELQIPFQLPSRSVSKISSLKGKLHALVPSQVEAFRFANLVPPKGRAKPQVQHKAGVNVTLERVRKNNEVWSTELRVKFDNPSAALESHRGWIFGNEVFMVDPRGRQIPHAGLEKTMENESEIGIQYLFDLETGPQGLTLVYKTPTSILEVPVEYELRDLELP